MDGSKVYVVPPSGPADRSRPMHRLGEVRRREGLSLQKIARHLGLSIEEVQRQENPLSDLRLSDLHHWQQALDVPIAELLVETNGELSVPIGLRTQLLRAMKTVRSIESDARQTSIRRLAEMLADQLVEIMPELKNASKWSHPGGHPPGARGPCEWHFPFEKKWT